MKSLRHVCPFPWKTGTETEQVVTKVVSYKDSKAGPCASMPALVLAFQTSALAFSYGKQDNSMVTHDRNMVDRAHRLMESWIRFSFLVLDS